MKTRIMIVDSCRGFGGAFEHLLTLSSELAKDQSLEVAVATYQTPHFEDKNARESIASFIISESFQVPGLIRRTPLVGRYLGNITSLLLVEIPDIVQMIRLFRNWRPDLVHLNNLLNSQLAAVFAAWLLRIPCISCHQGCEHPSRLARLASRVAATHIAISNYVKEKLIDFGIPEKDISIIYDGIDTKRFSPTAVPADLQTLFNIPKSSRVFALFGRLVHWKGHRVFIEAAAKIIQEIPEAHALIVGSTSDGPDEFERELRNLAKSLGIADKVTFAGYRANIPEILNAVDVVLHLSTIPEPQGLVVVEAMACAKPIVAVNQGGPKEIVEPGKTGFLVPPNDPQAAAEAVVKVLKDRELSLSLGRAARENVEETFSGEVCAREYRKLYETLLRPKSFGGHAE